MSTNYYIRRTKPVLCFPEFHVGKSSMGWKGLLQFSEYPEDTFHLETQRPVIKSMEDVKDAVESDEWKIYDEYGTEIDFDDFEKRMSVDGQSHVGVGIEAIEVDGFEGTYTNFS